MGRGLMSLGAFLLVATIALWIAGTADWLDQGLVDGTSAFTLKAGLVMIAAALVLRLVSPVTRRLGQGRCTTCGAPVEKGHVYCLDHLKETVHTYRDRTHQGSFGTPRRRG